MKIAILGSAPSSKLLAPYKDPEWEIWACSNANGDLPRIDAVFELHDVVEFERMPQLAGYMAWLKEQAVVYMIERLDRYPGSVVYPKDDMLKMFGPYFFSSSIAWMMALAISKKPEALGLFGIDMTANDEYGFQRPGCQYFIQKAHEAGINVIVPPQSDIAQPAPLYGYKEADRFYRKTFVRREELWTRLAEQEAIMREATRAKIALQGAIEDIDYTLGTWAYLGK
jgi:hypothetical protein